MRDLKFRVWDKNNKCWQSLKAAGLLISGDNNSIEVRSANLVVMQFTGLTDCHGVEIYEGDIIEHGNGDRFQVEDVTPPRKEMYYEYEHYDDFLSMSDVDYEVIGNIYENPELLEVKQ